MRVPPVVLSIAGYDPSSGAGVTADVKTAAALGCYAVTCITALTVQSTQGVFHVQPLGPKLVARTLVGLVEDLEIAAVRLGMLGSGEVAEVIAEFLDRKRLKNIVLDPVIHSSSGVPLLDESGIQVLRQRLLPRCEVVTPNIKEAAILTEIEAIPDGTTWDSAQRRLHELAAKLHDLGAPNAVITGGQDLDPANDYLSCRVKGGDMAATIKGERLLSRATHGTGCAYATAFACRLALGDGPY